MAPPKQRFIMLQGCVGAPIHALRPRGGPRLLPQPRRHRHRSPSAACRARAETPTAGTQLPGPALLDRRFAHPARDPDQHEPQGQPLRSQLRGPLQVPQPAARDSIPITGSGRLTTTGRVRSAIRPGADCGSLRQRTDRRPFGVARVATFRLASMPFRSAQSQASGVSLRRGPATPYRPAGRRRCKLQRRKRKKIFQSTRVTDSLV